MGCRKLQQWSIIEFDDKTSTHEVGFILRLRRSDGLNNLAYINNGVTNKIDFMGAWGIQFGDYNIGIGNPTLAFGGGAVEVDSPVIDAYHDATVGTLDAVTVTESEAILAAIEVADLEYLTGTVLQGVRDELDNVE